MTQKEAIALAAAVRPHALSEDILEHFLGEVEGRIAVEVKQHDVSELDATVLSVPAPFDRLYWSYLVAMIDLAAGDTDNYRISRALFEEAYNAFARWYQRRGKTDS